MARKIFVSYKHSDPNVFQIDAGKSGRARDYVDVLEKQFDETHIYKGERDGEDLSHLKDLSIKSHLRDQIFDSSVTVVLVSAGMVEIGEQEKDQFIPWEISYSLKNIKRTGKLSKLVRRSPSNALLVVVLPDQSGSYGHFMRTGCSGCVATTLLLDRTFPIIAENFFNLKGLESTSCPHCVSFEGAHSYISYVDWDNFIANPNLYIDDAVAKRDLIDDYKVVKQPSQIVRLF